MANNNSSYVPQQFKDGQTLNAEHLNHIEEGILNLEKQLNDSPNSPVATVQADHAQNDPTQPDYIKNRLGWAEPPIFSLKQEFPKTFEEITWDGDIIRKTKFQLPISDADMPIRHYKVSDVFISREQLLDSYGCLRIFSSNYTEDQTMVLSEEMLEELTIYYDEKTYAGVYFTSVKEPCTVKGEYYGEELVYDIPEAGTYFIYLPSAEDGGGYISSLSGKNIFSKDDFEILADYNENYDEYFYMNKVSDEIIDKDDLLNSIVTITDIQEDEIRKENFIFEEDYLETAILDLGDGNYVILMDGMPFMAVIATPGAIMGIEVKEAGTYLAFITTGELIPYMYISEITGFEKIHKIDSKYLDIVVPEQEEIQVDNYVSPYSYNPVSGSGVYDYVNNGVQRELNSFKDTVNYNQSTMSSKITQLEEKSGDFFKKEKTQVVAPFSYNWSAGYYHYSISPHSGWSDCSLLLYRISNNYDIEASDLVGVEYNSSRIRWTVDADDIKQFGRSFIVYDDLSSTTKSNINFLYVYNYTDLYNKYVSVYKSGYGETIFKLPSISPGLYIAKLKHNGVEHNNEAVNEVDTPIYRYTPLEEHYIKTTSTLDRPSVLPPTSGAVINALEKLSTELTDSVGENYYNKTEFNQKLLGRLKYCGIKENYSDLPPSYSNSKGDVWKIINANEEFKINAGDHVYWVDANVGWTVLSGGGNKEIYIITEDNKDEEIPENCSIILDLTEENDIYDFSSLMSNVPVEQEDEGKFLQVLNGKWDKGVSKFVSFEKQNLSLEEKERVRKNIDAAKTWTRKITLNEITSEKGFKEEFIILEETETKKVGFIKVSDTVFTKEELIDKNYQIKIDGQINTEGKILTENITDLGENNSFEIMISTLGMGDESFLISCLVLSEIDCKNNILELQQEYSSGIYLPYVETSSFIISFSILISTEAEIEIHADYLDSLIPKEEKGAVNGVATLNALRKIPKEQLPEDLGVQSDWLETDSTSLKYIKNKPFMLERYALDIVWNGELTDLNGVALPQSSLINLLESTGVSEVIRYVKISDLLNYNTDKLPILNRDIEEIYWDMDANEKVEIEQTEYAYGAFFDEDEVEVYYRVSELGFKFDLPVIYFVDGSTRKLDAHFGEIDFPEAGIYVLYRQNQAIKRIRWKPKTFKTIDEYFIPEHIKLPKITEEDEGKILMVVGGKAKWVSLENF